MTLTEPEGWTTIPMSNDQNKYSKKYQSYLILKINLLTKTILTYIVLESNLKEFHKCQ